MNKFKNKVSHIMLRMKKRREKMFRILNCFENRYIKDDSSTTQVNKKSKRLILMKNLNCVMSVDMNIKRKGR